MEADSAAESMKAKGTWAKGKLSLSEARIQSVSKEKS